MKLSTKLLLSLLIVLVIADIILLGTKPIATARSVYSYTNGIISGDKATLPIDETSGDSIISGDILDNSQEITEEPIVEPEPTQTPTPVITKASTPTKKLTSSTTYYIKVNNRQNVVNIYTKDESGEYTIPYKAMICSVGDATPAAGKTYKTTTYKTRWNGLVHNVYGQYITQIVGDILFHSVPYTAKDVSTLEYWEYDKLGEAASAGCVRLTVQDAKWIYDNVEAGTIVEFYEDDNPGPFGKPTAQKISDNERCRNWDPTDPEEGNPWNTPEEIVEEDILIDDTHILIEENPATQVEEMLVDEPGLLIDDIIISED